MKEAKAARGVAQEAVESSELTVEVARLRPPRGQWTEPGKIREPDILFVSKEHTERIGEQVYGPPDLVVEVLSTGTRRTDRLEKPVEYAQAGVSEYWIVDPERQTVEVFILRQGAYELLSKWGKGEKARSGMLAGFEVAVEDLMAELAK